MLLMGKCFLTVGSNFSCPLGAVPLQRPVTPRSCAASWSIPSSKEQGASVKQGTTSATWNGEQAVHEMAVAPVIESLESGVRAWTLMENR